MSPVFIEKIGIFLPNEIVSNAAIEAQVRQVDTGSQLPAGLLQRLFGCGTRRFAASHMQVSDLAAEAARKILVPADTKTIDLLIFAAASSDLIEPATANIVQAKLGLQCPVMDIKNACNSFASALQVASAFIASGVYRRVLIVNGEKLSQVIQFNPRNAEHLRRCLSGYTLGDAGAAMIVSTEGPHEVVHHNFNSWGEHWPLCTVAGGGSQSFRNPDSYYFESDTAAMGGLFKERLPAMIESSLAATGWTGEEVNFMVSHQVAGDTAKRITASFGRPLHHTTDTFRDYGNVAAATLPLALHQAAATGEIGPGSKVMALGLAAGISLSVQLFKW